MVLVPTVDQAVVELGGWFDQLVSIIDVKSISLCSANTLAVPFQVAPDLCFGRLKTRGVRGVGTCNIDKSQVISRHTISPLDTACRGTCRGNLGIDLILHIVNAVRVM